MEELKLRPIAHMRCPEFLDKRSVARQPNCQPKGHDGLAPFGFIEWTDTEFGRCASEDINEGDRLWLLFWFHRQKQDYRRPKVLPPTSEKKVGLFSTRSPYRPNPIGLTKCIVVEKSLKGIRVANHDLLDGTPIFDIKPYISFVDSEQDAPLPKWLKSSANDQHQKSYRVLIPDFIADQFSSQSHVLEALKVQLQDDPTNSLKNKRIKGHTFAFKKYRFEFQVDERSRQVDVISVQSVDG